MSTAMGSSTPTRWDDRTMATNRHRQRVALSAAAAVAGALAPLGLVVADASSAPAAFATVATTSTAAPPNPATTTTAITPTMAPPTTVSACTAEGIGADTGMTLRPDVVCSAGFAMALRTFQESSASPTATAATTSAAIGPATGCARVDTCASADYFHVTTSGWVHDGSYTRECAEDIEIIFISPGAAAAFAPVCDPAGWPAPETVQRGSRGTAVMYVQIALVGLGSRLDVNGTFDIVTYQAVQQFQDVNGLEATGVVGPETHALLGTGPNPPRPPPATTTPGQGPTTTIVVTRGDAPECSAAAITADTDIALVGEPRCAAGWAVITPPGCGSDAENPDVECEDYDVFHITDEGWIYDGTVYSGCAWSLAGSTGMSEYTALTLSFSCDVEPVARTVIAPGSTGEPVVQLQIALIAIGYPVAVDGAYGPLTQAAVRDFQRLNGLEVDGIAGPQTQAPLGI